MNLLLESRNIGEQKRKNKALTLSIMGGFALFLTLLGYGFDELMATYRDFQLITVPIAIVLVGSLLFNLVNGLNERFFGNDGTEDRTEYYTNKMTIWMVSTALLIIFWMVYYELSYLDPHVFGKPRALIALGETYPYGTLTGAALGAGAAFSTLQWGAYSILRSVGAAPADPSFEGDGRIVSIVGELSKAASIPAPAVYVVGADAPNAFSIGRSPKHASMVVSQGLIETLSPEEIEGVIAHEISHIRSYDIRPRTAVTALFGSAVLLSHRAKRATAKGGVAGLVIPKIGGTKRFLLLVFWLASLLVVPFAAYALVILTFRRREYLADASAAELTRNPRALSSALLKIEQAAGSATMMKRNVGHMCIIDPSGRVANSKEGWFADILATHPPTASRTMALQSMAPLCASR